MVRGGQHPPFTSERERVTLCGEEVAGRAPGPLGRRAPSGVIPSGRPGAGLMPGPDICGMLGMAAPVLRSAPLAWRRRCRLGRGCAGPAVRPVRCASGPASSARLALSGRRLARRLGAAWPPPLWPVGLVGRASPRPGVVVHHRCAWPPPALSSGALAVALLPLRARPCAPLATGGPPSRPGPWPRLGAFVPRRLGPSVGPASAPLGPCPRSSRPGAERPCRAAFYGPGPRACPCRGYPLRRSRCAGFRRW